MGLRALKHQWVATSSFVFACAFGAVHLTAVPVASAQTDEQRAGARALAEQGAAAYDTGRWQDAVDLFTRAQSLVDAPPHLLFIARAQEKQGHLVQAMEAYIKVTRAQLPSSAPAAFVNAQADAASELQALMPRIPHVTIVLSGEQAQDVVVKVDGEELPSVLVGVKRPANPGKHQYAAEGANVEAAPVTLAVSEGGEATVELILKPKAVAAAPITTPSEPAPAPVVEPPRDTERRRGMDMKIPAYASLGVGVVGVGLGTFFVIQKGSKSSDADAAEQECIDGGGCEQSEVDRITDLDKSAASAGTLSLISYGVGAAGIGVGLALLFMGGDEQAAQAPVTVWASGNQLGVVGRF